MLHLPCPERIFWLLRSRDDPSVLAEDRLATPTWSPAHKPSLPHPFQCHVSAAWRLHEDHLPSEWPGPQWRRDRQRQKQRCEPCLWWRCTSFGKLSNLEAMSLNRYELSEPSKYATSYLLGCSDTHRETRCFPSGYPWNFSKKSNKCQLGVNKHVHRKREKISAKIKLAEHVSPSNAALAAHPKFFNLTISPLADLAVGSAMIGMLGCFGGQLREIYLRLLTFGDFRI